MVSLQAVVDPSESPFDLFVRIKPELLLPLSCHPAGKLHESPHLRVVKVHQPLGRPAPVVRPHFAIRSRLSSKNVLPVHHIEKALGTGKLDSPLIPRGRDSSG